MEKPEALVLLDLRGDSFPNTQHTRGKHATPSSGVFLFFPCPYLDLFIPSLRLGKLATKHPMVHPNSVAFLISCRKGWFLFKVTFPHWCTAAGCWTLAFVIPQSFWFSRKCARPALVYSASLWRSKLLSMLEAEPRRAGGMCQGGEPTVPMSASKYTHQLCVKASGWLVLAPCGPQGTGNLTV